MNRGEVWTINLDPTIGAEIKKKRPCVIVNNNIVGKLPLKVIVPITVWSDTYQQADWHVKIIPSPGNGLTKTSSADTFQMRSLSENRFVNKLGNLTAEELEKIENGLRIVLLLP